ncbi:hypothetical protein [Actinomadura harenae]|uniref:hypothetical protein n=1 Tax=Actinomadura harenae TaxID=2483351 RepID=UPI0018F4911A|nr:hypothetical protein [Actinomadura harenae]
MHGVPEPGASKPGAPEHGPSPYPGVPAGHEPTYASDYGPPPEQAPHEHAAPPEYGTPSGYGTPSEYDASRAYGPPPEYGAPHEPGAPSQYGTPQEYGTPGGYEPGRVPEGFGHGEQQPTELDVGYSSPPTAYDLGTPVPVPPSDPGAAYGPPPEPWGGGSGLSATPPPPPDGTPGEHTITLSPEPWAAEPQVWSPPPPAETKRRPPYLLIATGLVVLAAIALGIVFWPTGSGKAGQAGSVSPATQQRSDQPTGQGQPSDTPSATASSPSPSGDLTAQAGKVNTLLDDMSTTRGDLQTVLTDGCDTAGLQRIKGERQSELSTAQGLDVSALDDGQRLKDALVRALQASVASNAKYIELSPGCPSDSDVADVNQQATDAKHEFIGLWNPVAEKANLSSRTEASI